MNILDFKGKQASPGPIVVYQLVTGPVLYSETAKEVDDVISFDPERTLVMGPVQPGRNGQGQVTMQKMSEAGIFHPAIVHVPKTAIVFMHDCGNPEMQSKCSEALSGIIIPKGALPPA
ncbi:MAG TPA: hypothetical protein VJ553_05445 [Candidatus Paceibacterota bacterium]|nr:hypothetical protein [Candidatus Paceibacterota bacterium]